MSQRITEALGGDGRAIHAAIGRWVEAGLITREQAAAIEAFESGPALPARRVPLVTEALGYLGSALALAAGRVFLGQVWDEIARSGRLAILGGAAALLWLAGWSLRRMEEPALGRLMGVLWFGSVGFFAAFLALAAPSAKENEHALPTLFAGIGATIYGAVLWLVRKQSLQLLAAFGGTITLVIGVILTSWQNPPVWVVAIAVWALGGILLALGWREVATPAFAAILAGAVAAAIGPSVGGASASGMLFVGLATAVGLMAASVGLHRTELLGVGALAVFMYVVSISSRFFAETLGAPLTLLIAGVALLVLALVSTRLRRFTTARGEGTGVKTS